MSYLFVCKYIYFSRLQVARVGKRRNSWYVHYHACILMLHCLAHAWSIVFERKKEMILPYRACVLMFVLRCATVACSEHSVCLLGEERDEWYVPTAHAMVCVARLHCVMRPVWIRAVRAWSRALRVWKGVSITPASITLSPPQLIFKK